ncbi:MAG: TadE/TadG family type IV pilus assembly protein [Bacillota bacterium]
MVSLTTIRKNRFKGSLTVEACIALPVFLCIFMLVLYFGKLAYYSSLLDKAVYETVKQLAASSYPLALVNEYEEEFFDSYTADDFALSIDALDAAVVDEGSLLSSFLGGAADFDLETLLQKGYSIASEGLVKGLIGSFSNDFRRWKSSCERAYASGVLKDLLEDSALDINNVSLKLVKLPQSTLEYNYKNAAGVYRSLEAEGICISVDDVVIQAEYPVQLSFPIIGAKSIVLVSTYVEKAWVSGVNGIITEKDEGLELLSAGSSHIVYITRTGIRYHLETCRHLHSSKIPIRLDKAADEGYTPCKVCKP